MYNRDCFWKPFGTERVNESQKLLISAEKCFFATFSSFGAKLSYKNLFLIRFEILGLLANTLTANYEYSRSNRENLPLEIQIKLSKKPQTFLTFFFSTFRCYINLPMFWTQHHCHSSNISEVIYSKRCAYLNG